MNKESVQKQLLRRRVISQDGCWEWTGATDRYGITRIRGIKTTKVHRISYEVFVGPIPEGLCVLHRCDNTKCFNPEHLFCGTQADNVRDMINKGRAVFPSIPYGEKHPCAFISKDTVLAIREMAEKQPLLCQRRIAEKFGVSYQTCNDIIRLRRRKFG